MKKLWKRSDVKTLALDIIRLGPDIADVIKEIVKALRKTSPGGKRITKTERKKIVKEVLDLFNSL
jgi:hypothetical protein